MFGDAEFDIAGSWRCARTAQPPWRFHVASRPSEMPGTRVGPAAAQALQATLVVIFVLLPLFVPLWAIFSFVLVPTAARGLRNTDSTPGPRWLKWPLSLVSLPLKLAAGLAWLLYAYVTVPIQPFVLLVYELLRLCWARASRPPSRPAASVAAGGSPAASNACARCSPEKIRHPNPISSRATGRASRCPPRSKRPYPLRPGPP